MQRGLEVGKGLGRIGGKAMPRPCGRALRDLTILALAFVVSACASEDVGRELAFDEARAEKLFSAGYEDIFNFYIDEVAISDLAVAGLGSLTSLDPDLDIFQHDGRVSVALKGKEIQVYPAPKRMDTLGWGRLTAAAIAAGRSQSANLDTADSEALYAAVFDGALSRLDNFSRYAGREAARLNRESRDGFGGIGIRIEMVPEGVRVVSVMEQTPAELAGLRPGDIITRVDAAPITGLTQLQAISRLRGKLRTSVRLTLLRKSERDPLDVMVVRAHIVPQTINYSREGNIAHIRVSGFNQDTAHSLRQRIARAQAEIGADLTGYVLDLRGNPGGLLEQAIAVADIFVTEGRIVTTQGRHPESHQFFNADDDDLIDHAPVVILVNGNSASASEIVASALQDARRAVVVGSSSYGKGTVQTLLRLPNQGELILTWARFHAPSGYALNRRGVLPDICTSKGLTTVDSLVSRLRTGEFPFDPRLITTEVAGNDDSAVKAFRAHCPARDTESDIDFKVAQRLLEDPGLYALALEHAPRTADLQVRLPD